jgi:glycosyltransferase involved in cell wall biosynthesis
VKIEIVIPILNEEATLERQIQLLENHIKLNGSFGHQICITIADNGSDDRSPAISEELLTRFDNLKYIRIGKRGVGIALKRAWMDSKADIIGFMDLDFSTDLKHLEDVLSKFEDERIGLICGSRNKRESVVINRSYRRTITSRALNLILKRVFQAKFTDGMCGFKFLRRSHLNEILSQGVGFDGWFFSTEILIVAERQGIEIFDLPVIWEDDRESKVKIFQLSGEYIKNIIQLKRHFRGKHAQDAGL